MMLKLVVVGAVGATSLIFIVALGLIFSAEPKFTKPPVVKPAASGSGMTRKSFKMRDGANLSATVTETGSDTTIILVHGILSDLRELEPTAQKLKETTGANVVNLDLRGHGKSDGRFGDVTYIGQYEDDLADVVTAVRKDNPKARVILAGHSMGGGIVTRYSGKKKLPAVNGYLLFAPALGYNSPTTRNDPPGGDSKEEPFLKIHLKRIFGLLMMNAAGITAFNDLDTLYFNVSDGKNRLNYSYRAMNSMSPDELSVTLKKDDRPMLVLVGRNDEAFHAERFPDVMKSHANAKTVIVDGETHDGIIRSPIAFLEIDRWWAEMGK